MQVTHVLQTKNNKLLSQVMLMTKLFQCHIQRISCLSPARRYFRRCILLYTVYRLRTKFSVFSETHFDWSKSGSELIRNSRSPISCLFSLHRQSGNQLVSFTKAWYSIRLHCSKRSLYQKVSIPNSHFSDTYLSSIIAMEGISLHIYQKNLILKVHYSKVYYL